MKKVKAKVPKQPGDSSLIRRSSRVADKPPVNYKDVTIEPEGRSRIRSCGSGHSKRDLSCRVYASEEDTAYAKQRAYDLQSSLDQDTPSFVKSMLPSHVTGGYWLGLSVTFCKTHLPEDNETFYLVDEKGKEFETQYLVHKSGLSGGWGGFAKYHNLVHGDALVFQLTARTTFKVYIIRVNEPGE